MDSWIETERLRLRPWRITDADQAQIVFGDAAVTRWLSPGIDAVKSLREMELLLEQWVRENDRAFEPVGRWAMETRADPRVIGEVTIRYLPPDGQDLGLAWALAPSEHGHGYATEGAKAVAGWAFEQHTTLELLAVMHSTNHRAAALARRLGMEWTGETDKYYDRHLQVYRLTPGDLDARSLSRSSGQHGRPDEPTFESAQPIARNRTT